MYNNKLSINMNNNNKKKTTTITVYNCWDNIGTDGGSIYSRWIDRDWWVWEYYSIKIGYNKGDYKNVLNIGSSLYYTKRYKG